MRGCVRRYVRPWPAAGPPSHNRPTPGVFSERSYNQPVTGWKNQTQKGNQAPQNPDIDDAHTEGSLSHPANISSTAHIQEITARNQERTEGMPTITKNPVELGNFYSRTFTLPVAGERPQVVGRTTVGAVTGGGGHYLPPFPAFPNARARMTVEGAAAGGLLRVEMATHADGPWQDVAHRLVEGDSGALVADVPASIGHMQVAFVRGYYGASSPQPDAAQLAKAEENGWPRPTVPPLPDHSVTVTFQMEEHS